MNLPDETTDPHRSADTSATIRQQAARFRAAWHQFRDDAGGTPRPSLWDYLEGFEGLPRAELFRELLDCERLQRRQLGETVRSADYESTLPEFAPIVREVFSGDDESAGMSLLSTATNVEPLRRAVHSPREPESLPQALGRYQVRALIDAGAYGSVYQAYDPDLDRVVAIKVPHRRHITSAADVQLFLKEAKVLARLEHPHIVPVYDSGATDDGRCFIVSKWVEGINLATALKQHRPDYQESARWVAAIAATLQVAHRQKIVHRDLKPANILLDSARHPYLTDFGLALREEDFGNADLQGMTPAYASPEQARGESHLVDGRSDIYSLGVVMYELLIGERPFVAANTLELLERIKTLEPRPLRQLNASIPHELERICLKMLAKRPADRYGAAIDLENDLRQYLSGSAGAVTSARSRRVFISYRHEDSLGLVGRIYDRLQTRYGKDEVLLDVASLDYGGDFHQRIEKALDRSDVLLAVIGQAWRGAAAASDGPGRLADEQDYVRIEIEMALERGIPVIPLLIGATRMPTEQQLPRSICQLAFKHAKQIDPGCDFDHHVEVLCGAIDHAQRDTNDAAADAPLKRQARAANSQRIVTGPAAGDARVITKGLRSFEERDADFFLQLLPGATDRDGLPESLRFWKTQIELLDDDQTFRVGLIFGPSGCGKSSLVKAGLLPRLSDQVMTIYLEATADQTERRLLTMLRKHFPGLREDLPLVDSLARLRCGQDLVGGEKLLIVVDQFEQWLHAHSSDDLQELTEGLRQCDGTHLQTLLLVRDDFWMPVTRFMRQLDVELVQGQNFAPVDLFPLPHARKVLALFGRANGDLPADCSATSAEQQAFLEAATADLAKAAKVICVRLALFAEMMKGKPWTPATLWEVGGTEGLGVTFLEERFSASTANPKHRLHQKAARAVLKSLLPSTGTDIKGNMRPREELLAASGYADRLRDFAELMQVLDPELRLITPTDREGQTLVEDDASLATDSLASATTSGRWYQLTHDYLVEALREWLTRKQRETRRGRAELVLAERAAMWSTKSENRSLPSLWETLRIRSLTRRKSWTDGERSLMRRAQRFHGTRLSAAVAVVAIGLWAVLLLVDTTQHSNADALVKAAVTGPADGLETAIGNLLPVQSHAALLLAELPMESLTPAQRLHALCARAALGQPDILSIVNLAAQVDDSEIDNMVTALRPARELALSALKVAAQKSEAKKRWDDKVRLATVTLYLGDTSLAADMLETVNRPDPVQRTTFISRFAQEPGKLETLLIAVPDFEHLEHAGAISGICLAVGSIDPEMLNPATREAWHSRWRQWYVSHPDSGVHSAAGWATRRWKLEPPEIPTQLVPEAGRSWCHTPQGLVMLQMSAGEYVETDDFNQPASGKRSVGKFLLSDREITVRLFRQFRDDAAYHEAHSQEIPSHWEGADERVSPSDNHPVQNVSWFDAIMFCNWLSRQEARQPCYERIVRGVADQDQGEAERQWRLRRVADQDQGEAEQQWRLREQADGYRLPYEFQWEYACRAGTQTAYACGDTDAKLPEYAVYNATNAAEVGSRKCNAWGLFDMHGNVAEWSKSLYYARGSYRMYQGGAYGDSSWHFSSVLRQSEHPGYRSLNLGFRVALVPSDK